MKLGRTTARKSVPKAEEAEAARYLAEVRRYWLHTFAVQDRAYAKAYPKTTGNAPAFSSFWDAAKPLLIDLRTRGVDIHYLVFLLSAVAWLYQLPGSDALRKAADRRKVADRLSTAAQVLPQLAPLYCSGEEANQLSKRLSDVSNQLREGPGRARIVGIHQAAYFRVPLRGRPKSYAADEVLFLMYEYLKTCGIQPIWDTTAGLLSLVGLSADSDSIRHRVKKYRARMGAPPTSLRLHWENFSYRAHLGFLSTDPELNR